MRVRTLAVPPPPFDAPFPLARRLRRVRVTLEHLTEAQLSFGCLEGPFLDSSGLWAILWSDSQPPGPFAKALATHAAHPRLRFPPYHQQAFPRLPNFERDQRHFLRSSPHQCLAALEWAGGPCFAQPAKLGTSLWLGSSPVLFSTTLASGRPGLFAQLPFSCPVTNTAPVLSVLASGVFRFDATALSFATVRWHGIVSSGYYECSAAQATTPEPREPV